MIFIQLWLSKKVYTSSDISIYGLAAYCAIKTLLYNEETTQICTSYEILAYQLTKNIHCSRRFYDGIKTGYGELIQYGFVKKIDSKSKFDVVDCSKLFGIKKEDFFTIISYAEILKIFQIENINVFMLLKYFIFLIGSINSSIDVYINSYEHKNCVVGNMTFQYLAQETGISRSSIIEYNRILEENELIYIYDQHDFVIDNTSSIKTLPSVYGRFSDKDFIEEFGANQTQYNKSYTYVKGNAEKTNSKRRLAQIYNQLCKNNDSKYSKKDIIEVYSYVLNENKKYKTIYKQKHDEACLKKIRDVNIFKKYDFLERGE